MKKRLFYSYSALFRRDNPNKAGVAVRRAGQAVRDRDGVMAAGFQDFPCGGGVNIKLRSSVDQYAGKLDQGGDVLGGGEVGVVGNFNEKRLGGCGKLGSGGTKL